MIVTDNLADFPDEALALHAIDAISADDFIADTIDPDPSEAILASRRMRERIKNFALDVPTLIRKSEAQRLLQAATLTNEFKAFLSGAGDSD